MSLSSPTALPTRRRTGLVVPSPLQPLAVGWTHRRLIRRLVRREIESRYRGSLLGLAWAVAAPLFMLTVYTFVFSMVLKVRWATAPEHKGVFALVLFAGMLAFNLVSECVNRAPGLVLENASYVKRVVFPLETLVCAPADWPPQ